MSALERQIGALIAFGTFAAYAPTLANGFVQIDDPIYVLDNPWVRPGLTLGGLVWAFSGFHLANWHPLTWLSHMLDCQLFGVEPFGHHLTSLVLHTANAVLLFALLVRMTRTLWPAGLAAALFALHPLHVESVAWVAERKDVLSTFFGFLTLWAYTGYVRAPSLGRYAGVALLFVLSLLSKPTLVTLPLVLLLLDYWPLERAGAPRRLLVEKLPLLLISSVFCAVTWLAQSQGGIRSLETYPLVVRLSNALVSYVGYLGHTLWPLGLSVYYPHPREVFLGPALSAALLLAAVSAVALRYGRRFRYLPVGWFWYLGTLVPVVGIVQVGDQAMADRYAYVPLVGLFVAFAWGARDAARAWSPSRLAAPLLASALLIALAVATFAQARRWESGVTLVTHSLAVVQDKAPLHNLLGSALMQEKRYEEAIEEFDQALRHNPYFALAWEKRGTTFLLLERQEEALSSFAEALDLNPSLPDAHYGAALIFSERGEQSQAIRHLEAAVQIQPSHAQAHEGLGVLYAMEGRLEDAVTELNQVLRLNPSKVWLRGLLELTEHELDGRSPSDGFTPIATP